MQPAAAMLQAAPGIDQPQMPGPSRTIVERAAAKINLSLEIVGRRDDGYHRLVSLVAFAVDIADTITLSLGRPPGVTVSGPHAIHLAGENIVQTALSELARSEPELRLGHFAIEKHIPVAAGLGGGSADAAAALRAVAAANAIADYERRFLQLAARLGADVPVCLGGAGATGAAMAGIGEVVWRPDGGSPVPADVFALLVNPGRPVSTAAVFRRLAAREAPSTGVPTPTMGRFRNLDDLLAHLNGRCNDLEPPARAIEPMIATVLSAIAAQTGCRLARMSGSGATCFGLFGDRATADAARDSIQAAEPNWWCATSAIA
jgi:4-diphosphocytidyl-2-C-methyl-D-erythritol kinase